jgi:hypothetical protein
MSSTYSTARRCSSSSCLRLSTLYSTWPYKSSPPIDALPLPFAADDDADERMPWPPADADAGVEVPKGEKPESETEPASEVRSARRAQRVSQGT